MPRAKRFSDVKRAFLRRLARESESVRTEMRDRIWDDLISRKFFDGCYSMQRIAEMQPRRNEVGDIENAIRRVVKRRRA